MLRLPSLFKTPKPRRFEFKTRYYDAEKEAFEERIKAATDAASERQIRLRHQFDHERSSRKRRPETFRMIRVISILSLLLILFYLLLR